MLRSAKKEPDACPLKYIASMQNPHTAMLLENVTSREA